MSEENSPSQEPSAPKAEAKPRARRVSTPRPKKTASVKAEAKIASSPAEPVISAPEVSTPVSTPVPDREVAERAPAESSQSSQEWPEPETSEGSSSSGENKRKRRRRKGKGGQNASNASANEESPAQQAKPQGGQQTVSPPTHSAPQQAPRTSVNPEVLAKKAWKIFLSEVSEEGVALISDLDARELSKRCFRLAEIFMDEQSRKIRQ